jgi:hypothetical protein|tara:strand:- start:1596 stop:2615 length:1020 start_codon:yes stop_codon:yes gene_type:complete
MSAYKKLNRQDVYVSDYSAKKQWIASGSTLVDYKIETLRGFSGSTPGYPYPLDLRNNRYQELTYNSIDNMYYADGIGNGLISGSRNLALQTSLTISGSRDIKSEIGVLSIPRDVVGTHIEPKTFSYVPQLDSTDNYIEDGYSQDRMSGVDLFTEKIGYQYGANPIDTGNYVTDENGYFDESVEEYVDLDKGQQRVEIIDDGNGSLIYSGSDRSYTQPAKVIGDIIYNHGLVIITDEDVARYLSTYSRHKLRWKSNQPIYTYNVHCKVKDSELNHTYNSSALTGSFGLKADNVSGSNFTPYITTVGMYNDANELIAVAKTNHPIQKTQNTDMTFVVKIDI